MTKKKRWNTFHRIWISAFVVLFGLLTVILCTSAAWMFETWQHLSMEELVYQLNAPIEGTNMEMIEDYIRFCIPIDVLVLGTILILLIGFRKKRYGRMLGGIFAVCAGVLATTCFYTWNQLDVGTYISNQSTTSDFINSNYVDPEGAEMTFPEEKRNLIYIFLESMETTYTDEENGGGFAFNCIPELAELAQEYEDFSGMEERLNGGYVMPNTSWTAAAMFGQSSGMPLTGTIDTASVAQDSSFLPHITTIGDILNEEGYTQTLLIGSDATFGSRRTLYTEHGEFQIKDYPYAVETGWIPEGYNVWWGYEDEKLFDFAKQELTQLAAAGEPFNLTMLTADTHFEDGYFCELCEDEFGGNVYANVMACSSRQVSEFVRWVQDQPFYENTTIVLAGDHLTMDADFCEKVEGAYVRKTYVNYIHSAVEPQSDAYREYTTLDAFPTTLASLGVQIEGDRLGLGTNLFSDKETLIEQFGISYVATELLKRTELIESMVWGVPIAGENYLQQDYSQAKLDVWYCEEWPECFSVSVSELKGKAAENTEDMQVFARVSRAENGIGGVWVPGYKTTEEIWRMDVWLGGFWYQEGLYYIDVYTMDSQGNVTELGSTTGYIG